MTFYDAHAVAYAADGSVNSRLLPFLSKVPRGGSILELGTGSGKDAKVMIEEGFVVDATDGSTELAAIASNYIGQTVRTMRFEELAVEEAYDGIYASASLLHVPRTDLQSVLRKIHAALRPNGVVWASFKMGSEEGVDSLGRYYNYLHSEELMALWEAAGLWANKKLEQWLGSGFDDQPTNWAAITAIR
ncbi:class I SAM-dependent methyltransferase [Devosia rhizoryzae]|uniref:class I SAM-dependent methyltransferase n=1 Tax=Devosia rhizoryzae TaxID=2774137 RepID=UPI001E38EFE7|nr:class I SAM-dependent methyltransferase [Devosia rhizoryzae]